MAPNPFFEKTVCIQTDHRHRVIDSEAFVHVRHPGYVEFDSAFFWRRYGRLFQLQLGSCFS